MLHIEKTGGKKQGFGANKTDLNTEKLCFSGEKHCLSPDKELNGEKKMPFYICTELYVK